MKLSHLQFQTIRQRHVGYRITFLYEVLLLVLLPVAQLFHPLLSWLLIGLALVLMVFANRSGRLLKTRGPINLLGCGAIGLELIWQATEACQASAGRWLSLPHTVAWLLFFVVVVVRGVRALIREPFVTLSVLQGAACGYLTLGFAGGVMLNALWELQPSAFIASSLPSQISGAVPAGSVAPALTVASFGLLTSMGTQVLNPTSVTAGALATLITISGQLYLAILIGMILGRLHQRRG